MRCSLLLVVSVALILAGCATHLEQISARIREKPDALSVLSEQDQARIRGGKLLPGDSKDAAWLVYGEPVRRYSRVTADGRVEIWSYTQTEFDPSYAPTRAIMRPVRTASGHTVWVTDGYATDNEPRLRELEVLRIEFKDGKVTSLESMQNP